MSGIYGILRFDKKPVEQEQMTALEIPMLHRAIDGKGAWADGHIGLGHLKTELTPESTFEQLPLSYRHFVITADARIDNRPALFAEFNIPERLQPEMTDPELIVRAYEKWGENCCNHLIGDFAFAIWDTQKKHLFCARDHVGVRPFFYYFNDDFFIFASDIKPLAEFPDVPCVLNELSMRNYLFHIDSTDDLEETCFKGIFSLLAANCLSISNYFSKPKRYWDLDRIKKRKFNSKEDCVREFKALVTEAVHCRLRTKYPIGVHLSGGVDSSTVACIAAQKLALDDKELYATSSVLPKDYEGQAEDEREYIEAVINQEKNIRLYYMDARNLHYLDEIDSFHESTYYPAIYSGYIDKALNKTLIKDGNVRLVLTGMCGDVSASCFFNTVPNLLLNLKFSQAVFLLKKRAKNEHKKLSKVFLDDVVKPFIPRFVFEYKSLLQTGYKYILWNETIQDAYIPTFMKLARKYRVDNFNRYFPKRNIKYAVRTWTGHIFEKADIRHAPLGIKHVHPLMDKRIVEFMLSIPISMFEMNGWKRGLIRFAMKDILPEKVRWRLNKGDYSPNQIEHSRINIEEVEKYCEQIKQNKFMNVLIDADKLYHILSLESNYTTANHAKRYGTIVSTCLTIITIQFLNTFFLTKNNKNEKRNREITC